MRSVYNLYGRRSVGAARSLHLSPLEKGRPYRFLSAFNARARDIQSKIAYRNFDRQPHSFYD